MLNSKYKLPKSNSTFVINSRPFICLMSWNNDRAAEQATPGRTAACQSINSPITFKPLKKERTIHKNGGYSLTINTKCVKNLELKPEVLKVQVNHILTALFQIPCSSVKKQKYKNCVTHCPNTYRADCMWSIFTCVFLLLPDRWAPAALAVSTARPQRQPAGHGGLQLEWSSFILLVNWWRGPIRHCKEGQWSEVYVHQETPCFHRVITVT